MKGEKVEEQGGDGKEGEREEKNREREWVRRERGRRG